MESTPSRHKHIDWARRTIRIELFILIVGGALLLAAVSLFLALSSGSPLTSEAKRVSKTKYQAVFINGSSTTAGYGNGSLYFGHITKLNDNYLVLNDVFFLTTPDSTNQKQAASPQLSKLGCQQLHSPYDEMVINRSQVAFWENLQDSGKVALAIKQFKDQNPNGPDCSSSSNQTQPSGTNTQTNPTSDTP